MTENITITTPWVGCNDWIAKVLIISGNNFAVHDATKTVRNNSSILESVVQEYLLPAIGVAGR